MFLIFFCLSISILISSMVNCKQGRQLRRARSVTGEPANVSSQDWGQQPWAGLTFTMVAAVLLPSARSAGGAAGGCDSSLAAYNTTSTKT